MSSILEDTKKNLGILPEYDVFDGTIIMHINTALSTLTQLGIGPPEGYAIEDNLTEWEAFSGLDLRRTPVRTYVYLKVRMYFDPPGTSYLIAAMEKQMQELEWRMSVDREADFWQPPEVTIDGGDAVV
jgi:hypothetical protein